MLCECDSSPQNKANFLDKLATLLTKHNLNKNLRAKLLIWVLVREMQREDTARLWWLVRAMRVIRRVTFETTDLLHQVLLGSLTRGVGADTEQQVYDLEVLTLVVRAGLA
jgi:hypothetical protein